MPSWKSKHASIFMYLKPNSSSSSITSSYKSSCLSLLLVLFSPFFFLIPFCLSNQYCLTMEKPVAHGVYPSLSPFYLVGFVGFFISQRILNLAIRILQFSSVFHSLLQSPLNLVSGSNSNVQSEQKSPNPEHPNKQLSFDEKIQDGKLCQGVEMVMEKLGICCDPDEEKLQERLGLDGILHLFEEKDPTTEELKEAFEVFDENRDGYIDAEELQRVLSALGFVEGLMELGQSKKMIAAFDTNDDGRIDIAEFVKIVENSFC